MENPDLDVAEVGVIERAYLARPTFQRGAVPSAPSNGGQCLVWPTFQWGARQVHRADRGVFPYGRPGGGVGGGEMVAYGGMV